MNDDQNSPGDDQSSTSGSIPSIPNVPSQYPPASAPSSTTGTPPAQGGSQTLDSPPGPGDNTPTTTAGVQSSSTPTQPESTGSPVGTSSLFGSSKDIKPTSQDSSPPSPLTSSTETPSFNSRSTANDSSPASTSVLDPSTDTSKSSVEITPGTPGNQISPPITSTSPNLSSATSESRPESLAMNTTPPISSSASGEPLHLGTDQKEEDKTIPNDQPLKSPPMPGSKIENDDDDKKTDGTQPSTPPTPSTVISTSDSGSGSKFKIIVIILIVITVLVYAVVAFLFFTKDEDNSPDSLGDSSSSEELTQNISDNTPTSTPTPPITEEIKINNGDVVLQNSIGDTTVLVKKNDYPSTGIVGFSSVSQSPDKEKLCFYSLSPADDPALYVSETDGTEVTKIQDSVSTCIWSNGSTKLAFADIADPSSPVDVYYYDFATKENKNLTNQAETLTVFRRYEIETWSPDDSKISCNYVEIDTQNTNEESLGNCEINATTGEVLDL